MYNYLIIGGGIVGLATAYALKAKNRNLSILLLEKEIKPAVHQTGRNSGVIHSGVYYKPGSIKADLATRGSRSMIDFCREFGIAYEKCGKVIVATDQRELNYLDVLAERGKMNGLSIKQIGKDELSELEPHVNGIAALHVPEAGIVNYRKVSEVLANELVKSGVEIAYNNKVTGIVTEPENCLIEATGGIYKAEYLINCAGLNSDILATQSGIELRHRIVPFRGEYYELIPERRYLVKNLIYPVPNPSFPFLGVHFTRMIDGSIHAGPNAVLSLKREGYKKFSFNASDTWSTISYPGFWRLVQRHWQDGFREFYRSISKAEFVKSLQKLIPEISAEDLIPSPSGIRAQALNPDGSLVDDFLVMYEGRSIHVCNAPSPAATASLEIGKKISEYALNLNKLKTEA